MTTKIPNNEKILIVLKKYDSDIISSDLAEYCHINPKNIGRYLDKLADKKLISRKTIQEGKKRYITNKILQRGKNKKVNFTYNDVMESINLETQIEEIAKDMVNDNPISYITDHSFDEAIEFKKDYTNHNLAKETNKATLLRYIKVIAVRDLDAQRLGFKDKSELLDDIYSIILKL